MRAAIRFDGRGVWPWLLVALYTLAPFAWVMLATDDGRDETYRVFMLGLFGVTLFLGALGPFFLVFFVLLTLSILAGQSPYLGDCKSLGDEFMVYFPMATAVPMACLVTSAVIYRLGRGALAHNSRMLGNLLFPFIGLGFAWGTLLIAAHRIDVAVQNGWVCNGG